MVSDETLPMVRSKPKPKIHRARIDINGDKLPAILLIWVFIAVDIDHKVRHLENAIQCPKSRCEIGLMTQL